MRAYFAPGIWISEDDSLHVDAAAICKSIGFLPSPMNQEIVERVAIDMVKEHFGADLPVEVRTNDLESRPS